MLTFINCNGDILLHAWLKIANQNGQWLRGARSARADARLCTSSGINLIVPLSFHVVSDMDAMFFCIFYLCDVRMRIAITCIVHRGYVSGPLLKKSASGGSFIRGEVGEGRVKGCSITVGEGKRHCSDRIPQKMTEIKLRFCFAATVKIWLMTSLTPSAALISSFLFLIAWRSQQQSS